jgi:hypothetical protein
MFDKTAGSGKYVVRYPFTVYRLPIFTSDKTQNFSRSVHGYTEGGQRQDKSPKSSILPAAGGGKSVIRYPFTEFHIVR